MRDQLGEELRLKAASLPVYDIPVVRQARDRAIRAADLIADALAVDPTLTDRHRCRMDIDVVAEILRQLKPLARQTEVLMEHRRLVEAQADPREIARLGRTNSNAPDELDAASRRVVERAEGVATAALPDWNTPKRIRERSEAMLPSDGELKEIADQLRRAVKDSLSLPYPAEQAVRLAALADQIDPNR
jgi:hypothetical protein